MRKTMLTALLLAFALPAGAQELSEIRCGKVFTRAGATTPGFAVDKELHVMAQTASGGFNAGTAPGGATLKSIFLLPLRHRAGAGRLQGGQCRLSADDLFPRQ